VTLFPHFLDTPPPPTLHMWHVLSTFTSEITNKNCHVTFLLTPPPPESITYYFNDPLSKKAISVNIVCSIIFLNRVDRKKMIVEHHRRGVRVKALPIGIPYDRFEMLAKTAPKVFSNDEVKVILWSLILNILQVL
jgi:hypothetical protein